MTSTIKPVASAILALAILIPALPARAEAASPLYEEPGVAADDPLPAAAAEDAPPADTPAGADAAPASTGGGDQWHVSLSPYLWLAGVHGDVGALGRNVGFKASIGDLLSHLRLGVMGAVELRRSRFLTTLDLIGMRLAANNALAPPKLAAITSNITANAVILTPKIGVRLIDKPGFKVDALTGIRYWFFGENVNFSPSPLGLNYYASQSWVSPLVGGRITTALSPKLGVTILGNVGGWGAGSQLEYEVAGLLGLRISPKTTLQAGYRYLNLDYQGGQNGGATVRTTLSGIVIGFTRNVSKE